ncbi:beta-ketoacyl synthase N-terminal-like domain-containing protein [Streptomyces sp. NPDC053079]|uniref:beta-ketoacyl synthase N-terminal-like domain-containing protein n=1 Tax=Streptomyces sp. NPDC053079 TaxID=3365697 RepID=UPI0037D03FF2
MAVGTTGANTALLDSMDETVTGPGADRLRPASAPYFSLNTIAGRIAMEYAVKGWNLTLTSPRTAGLEAVLAGARAGAARRSDLLLAGSVETPLPPHNAGHAVSEAGSAILVIEPRASAAARSATAYGTCRVAPFFLPHPAGSAPQAVTGALARLLTPGGPVPATRLIAEDGPVAAAVAGQLRSLGSDVTLTPPGAGTLLPMLHIASALARGTAPHLVATASQDGTCALALVSPEPHRNPA